MRLRAFLLSHRRMLKSFLRKIFTRSYDGAGTGRRSRNAGEMPAMLSAMHVARGPLLRRARYLVSNNALAASAADAWVAGLIGVGIKPQSGHADAAIRTKLNLQFEAWTDDADADGLSDWYGIQSLMVRRMVVDGEAFAALITDGDRLRIRLIDPDQVDPSLNRELGNGRRIVQGIEFDAAGRRVAYHVLPEKPGMPFAVLPLTPTRIDARDMIHLFRPDVPGQVRGITWLAPVMLRISELDSWRDAQLVRQKIAAILTAFVTSLDGGGDPMQGVQAGSTLIGGGLEPGTIKYLDPGQDIKFSTPAGIGAEVIDFARLTEREIAVGMGLPVAVLTGDLSDVNYSSIRAGIVEWRRRTEALQHNVIAFQALRPVWRRWATLEVLSGRAGGTVEAALPVKHITPRVHWVDPVKDVKAELDAIAGGLMSRREAVTSRGVDVEALDAEIATDKARADALGLVFTYNTKAHSTDPNNADPQQPN